MSVQQNQPIVLLVEKEKADINRWIGQFYNSVAAEYFELYSTGKLNYEDMKIKFSYDIIN